MTATELPCAGDAAQRYSIENARLWVLSLVLGAGEKGRRREGGIVYHADVQKDSRQVL
jgi:hypothetical protein